MEVILLTDVKSLGKKGEICKVSDGYARNFIIPKGLGVEKNAKTLNDLKIQQAAEAKRQQELLDEAKDLGAKLAAATVTFTMKGGEGGRAFGSVSTKEIATGIKEQLKLDIDKKKLILSEPIRNFGTYNVPIKLHPQVTVELKVKVTEA